MLVELNSENFLNFVDYLQDYGKENNLKIHVMHEDIFNAMHTI
jgi:ACT domain-containing protein